MINIISIIGPIFGLIFGLILIFYKEKVSVLITKIYEKFPHDKEVAKALNISFYVKPIYIAILGGLLCLVGIQGVIHFIQL